MYHVESVSVMQSAGNPCKPKLCILRDIDILSTIIKPVTFEPYALIAVSVVSKSVTVNVDGTT